MQIGILLV
ncbi:Protein of unknown function [Bacillus thuringiensis]|uniref:Uncharacterized protein n=1 Tax=Bacillus thuringiensis TaxID=1428 RepID=A0A1C4DW21_BACTU|nr:Protein of unknown function [Bacillus thuringiensis]